MADAGYEPVEFESLCYRRIPVKEKDWYDHNISPAPTPSAFQPRRDDTTGLSVLRAKYFEDIEKAAQGKSPYGYYVAVLRVGDLRSNGIDVVPKPLENNPGHAEILGITYQNKNTDQIKEWKNLLAHKLTLRVEGPFASSTT